jgi:hypothetical protein
VGQDPVDFGAGTHGAVVDTRACDERFASVTPSRRQETYPRRTDGVAKGRLLCPALTSNVVDVEYAVVDVLSRSGASNRDEDSLAVGSQARDERERSVCPVYWRDLGNTTGQC